MNNKNDFLTSKIEHIGQPPNWMVTKGTAVITGFFLLFIIIISQISYNDVVRAKVVVTTSIPPVYIAPKANGILDEIRVGSGDMVQIGDILAVLRNPANTNDVLHIKTKLLGSFDTISSIIELNRQFPFNLAIGENQNLYNSFISSYEKLIQFKSLERESFQGEGLKIQTQSQSRAFTNQLKKLKLSKQRTALAKEQLSKQQGLYDKGVISHSELLNFQEKVLAIEETTQQEEKSLFLLEIRSSELKTASHDNTLNILELSNDYTTQMNGSRHLLLSAIQNWQEQYVLTASQEGKISTFDIWQKFQNVQKDDYVFSIVPVEQGNILGKMKVPIANSGKITKDCEVIIKLDNYPFIEWGSLKGRIIHVSDVPKTTKEESYYSMYLDIESLETSFDKKIIFKQEMTGTADIILQKKSLLNRMFFQFKSIWE